MSADEIACGVADDVDQKIRDNMDHEKTKWMRSHKKQAHALRQKAQQCICLDDMAAREGITRRDIFRQVLYKQRANSKGCMTLPVTICFVALYAFSARLHEDITNVFLLESAIKRTFSRGMSELNTLHDIWFWLSSGLPQPQEPGLDVVNTLFNQVDDYNDALPTKEWSRFLLYSQVQGAVILKQYRDSSDPFGLVLQTNLSSYAMKANASNEGFVSVAELKEGVGQQEERRLANLLRPELETNLPLDDVPDSAAYELRLYPTMPIEEVHARVNYLKHRQWLDKHTQMLVVQVLLLNAELGRPRLEEVQLKISLSRGGELYWKIQTECLFLEVWPPGVMSKGADLLWLGMLLLTLGLEVRNVYARFMEDRLWTHVTTPATPLEWFIIALGILNFMCLGMTSMYVMDLKEQLEVVMQLGSSAPPARQEKASIDLYNSSEKMINFMSQYRTLVSWYNIILIFRFFIAFRVQPRLAVVTNTLIAVTEDLAHFIVVLTPTFVAYMIAGNLLFGRRMEEFSTLRMSTGAMLRMMYESEFAWYLLSEEHFMTAALWVWSYLLFVVLLMLNLVLAIILDTYNEVRTNTDSADTIFVFLELVAKRVINCRKWIPDSQLEGMLTEMDEATTITKEDITEICPQMTQDQSMLLFRACRDEMNWQAKSDLTRGHLLKLSASVKLQTDETNQSILDLSHDQEHYEGALCRRLSGSGESLTGRKQAHAQDDVPHMSLRQRGHSRPFPGMETSPGGYYPPLLEPSLVPPIPGGHENGNVDSRLDEVPEWLLSLRHDIRDIDSWMAALQWQIHGVQWKWQHLNRMEEEEPAENSSRDGGRQDKGDRSQSKATSDASLWSADTWHGPLRMKGGNWLL